MNETEEVSIRRDNSTTRDFFLRANVREVIVMDIDIFPDSYNQASNLRRRETNIGQRFQELAQGWREETGFMSSPLQRVQSMYYKEIIRLGPDVVPEIIKELSKRPDNWFYILDIWVPREENPIKQDLNSFTKTVQAWVEYGKRKGYL